MKTLGIRERIKRQAVELVRAHPDGLRYSELFRLLRDGEPPFNTGTINSTIWNLDAVLPDLIWKPSKGLYRHAAFREAEAPDDVGARAVPTPSKVREDQFYAPFADWLKNEAEEVTHAIPLGGNIFKEKWGTPDVIGKRESRRSDVIKAPSEIVSAEIKVDTMQLVTAFGQACAFRLFSRPCKIRFAHLGRSATTERSARCATRFWASSPHAANCGRLGPPVTACSCIAGTSAICSRHKKAGPMPSLAMARSSQRRL